MLIFLIFHNLITRQPFKFLEPFLLISCPHSSDLPLRWDMSRLLLEFETPLPKC